MIITVQELKRKLDANEDLFLLDVREQLENQEFNIGGQLIPLGDIPAHISELEPYKQKEIVVYCRSGIRSGLAQQLLMQAGFDDVKNLQGGVVEWRAVFGD